MLLAKKYKTLEGAQKRAAFENAHKTPGNRNMVYSVAGFVDGVRNDYPYTAAHKAQLKTSSLHWQVEKKRREA